MAKFVLIFSLGVILSFAIALDPNKSLTGFLKTDQDPNSPRLSEFDGTNWDTLMAAYPINNLSCGMSCVDDSGYLYAIGGQTPISANVFRYNIKYNTWETMPPMPGVNANQTAAWWKDDGNGTDSSCIFVVGRCFTSTNKTSYRWTKATNRWDTIPDYPGDAYPGNMAAVIGDTLYLIHRKNPGNYTEFHKYAIRAGIWVAGETPLDSINYYGAICSYGNRLWQLGGWYSRKSFQCYRPRVGWTMLSEPPENVGGNRAMIVGNEGKIFAWGGGNGWIAWNGMAVYDTLTNIWLQESNLPKPWLGAFYGLVPDTLGEIGLHMAAGYGNQSSFSTHARGVWVSTGLNDVGVTKIILPIDTITPWSVIIPACSVYNYGQYSATYLVRMKIDNFYEDTILVSEHTPGTYRYLFFTSWTATRTGEFMVSCSTELSGDMIKANDRQQCSIIIQDPPTLWQTMESIPAGTSHKKPKSGSCMAGLASTGKIYFLKASNTLEFYIFSPPVDSGIGSWLEADPLPLGLKPDDGENPKKGSAMASYNNSIYILRGSNTLGFWEYNASGNFPGWNKLANIPAGVRKPKYGPGLVAITKNDTACIFAMKGSNTNEFYIYNILKNAWTQVTSPPKGASGRSIYKRGSCLSHDGIRYIYVLKGIYGDFFRYNIATNSWEELKRYDARKFLARDGKRKKPKDGASLVYHNNYVFMLKAGNTNELWRYDIANDTWIQMAAEWDIPKGAGRMVKGGGAMTLVNNCLYVSKGASTAEFYGLSLSNINFKLKPSLIDDNCSGRDDITGKFDLCLSPNPTSGALNIRYILPVSEPVKIRLYNINGRLTNSYTITTPNKKGILTLDTKKLPTGVYVLQFSSGNIRVTRKIVAGK